MRSLRPPKPPASNLEPAERLFQYFCVAFIDILGQRDAFAGIEGLPESDADKARLAAALKNTVGIVETIRDCFETFYGQFEKPSSLLHTITPELRATFQEIRRAEVKYYNFSDLFVARVSLKQDGHANAALNGIFRVFTAAGSMMIMALFAHHALRGAIEVGTGMLLKSNEVYGPVLNQAYGLERDVAGYPRIVIGHGTIAYLTAHSRTVPTDVVGKLSKMIADLCLKFIFFDTDGVPALDYLSPAFREAVGRKGIGDTKGQDLDATIAKAYQFIQSERERQYARQNMKLFHRYGQLEAYFRARMK